MKTSPVPNMAAPPGMCPGIAVLGGGGAGGDEDGSGNGGKDGNGGNGNGNGDGAGGDGKNGGPCGKGGAGGCHNCSHKVTGGDPVDIATGEMFTVPSVDLKSPGFIDLVFQRQYTTRLVALDLGIGHGWTHTFAWRFECSRRGILIQKGCGSREVVLSHPTPSEPSWLGDWVLSMAGHDYKLDTGDGYVHFFSPASATADHFLLRRVEHITGHAFTLEYNAAGKLSTITDTAGRRIVVENSREGRIASFSITEPNTGYTIIFARYEYDEQGNLVRVTNADGFVHTYTYDDDHRMVRQRYPNGTTFYYVYDARGRCIETWGDADGQPDPALAPDLPKTLEDRRTRAKGFAHLRIDFVDDGYVECSDSVRLQRFFVDTNGNVTKAVVASSVTEHTFDDHGNVASRIGPLDAIFTYKHDRRGRLVEETDPIGRTVRTERDAQGHPLRTFDYAGNAISCTRTRDGRGNLLSLTNQRGATTTYGYDEYGTMATCTDAIGGVIQYIGDQTGSMRLLVEPNGARWYFDYDYFGRLIRRIDPLGRIVTYGYTRGGLMRWARQEDLFVEYSYDGLGNVTQVVAPEGAYQIRWGGFSWPYERVEPNGDRIRAQYNREGWPVRHFNQAGETYEFAYDANGMCTRATRFHGATIENKYDVAHHRIKYVLGTGESLVSTRDLLGRETALEFSDGRTIAFDYDISGEIACATTPEGSFRFEYDEVGNVVAEYQEVDGVTHWVKARYDLADHLVGFTTSLGHTVQIQRDAGGERQAVRMEDGTALTYERNAVGLEIALLLPGGAAIETEYDERYRVSRRRVRCVARQPAIGASKPGWVGQDFTTSVDRSYRFSAADDLVEVVDREKGVTRYTYDTRRRLEAKVPERGVAERFLNDPTSNVYERGPDAKEREYGRGNLLIRRGATRYAYDREGRLIEKLAPGPEGTMRIWRYTWNAHDHLTAVETPDGLRVTFTYDPFARRATKRVFVRGETGGYRTVRHVRYVWFGYSLLHEIATLPSGERTVRTYAHGDRRIQPFAHRDEGAAASAPGEWCFYVGDILNTPETIILGDGRVVGEFERSAYGMTRSSPASRVTTAVRFAGQLADDETGLHYNLHRYYDPEVGRYISPDPLGVEAGENHFLYCLGNPVAFVDTVGLAGHGATCELDIKNGNNTTTWVPYSDPASKQNPEPGVLKSGYKQNKKVVNVPGAMEKDNPDNVIHNGKDKLGKTKNTEQPKAHTEQHATEWAEKNFDKKDLKNSHMKLGGKLPPCQVCNDKMAKYAKDHNATVDYAYPKNNKFTYTGAGGPFASSTDGKPLVKKHLNLEAAYQDRNSGGPSTGYNEYLVAKGTRKK